ncbi:MAG: tetratricopeptide repeat protein, partial [bacterium]|nr:tetratricopeptide repeat protein [bacterium]
GCIEKTEYLYKEVIKLDIEDEISWQAFALFYKDLGKYEDAEKCFKMALTIGPNHTPTIQAFAIFYLEKGKLEWVNDRNEAIEYYKKAEQQFKNAITNLENESKRLQPDKFSEIEKRLFNAYAKYLIDKTEWCNEYEERIKIDEEIDEILDKLVNKYSDHGQSIIVYAQFLLSYAKILPKYKKGENFIKAEKLLNEYIGENKNQKELSYFMALHVLANYYYKYKPLYYKQSIDFNKVEKLLKESSNSFNPKHNSVALNELGKFYVRWASSLRHNEMEYNQTMNSAKIAYENAMKIHGNIETALHLSKVYFNYAFYLQYLKKDPSEYIKKALEIAHKFTYIPFTFYYYLTNIGDEMINDGEFDQAMTVLKEAIKIGKSHKIDYGYSLWKLGEVYREKKDLEEAVNIYYEYAQSQNTSEGYIARRNSIKKLMHDNAITKNPKTTFYNRCITICNEFSEKNYNIKKTLRSCQDYGEDLLEVGQIQLAISIFNQGISIISNSEDLDESKKVKSLSIFYMNLGFCYKYLNDFTNAEINFEVIAKTLNSAYGYLKTSILLYDLNLYEKTLYYFNQFVESYPNTNDDQKKNIYFEISNGFQKYAECLEKINRISESVAYWKDYADLSYYFNPKSGARVYGIIGNNLMGKKMYVDAREYLIKSLRLDQEKEQKAKNFSRLGIINQKLFKWEEACICFENALKLRNDNRDKTNLYFCNNEFNLVIKDFDEVDVDHIISAGIILELKNEYDSALEKYNNALTILQPNDIKDLSNVSKLRFIADAFFVLGKKDITLDLYENTIIDMVTGIEKSAV